MQVNIKGFYRRMEASKYGLLRGVFKIFRALVELTRILRNRRYRSEWLTQKTWRNNAIQGSTFTLIDRYPKLFEACRDYFCDVQKPQIMSFGCSTGEEVKSILTYMPTASVVGVDINKWCLRKARQFNYGSDALFINRMSPEFNKLSDLDAIFCMAVFQKTENRMDEDNSRAHFFKFESFEQEMCLLHDKLKVGGLMIIDHTDFSFADTIIADRYSVLDFEYNKIARKRPLFGRNNQKNSDSQDLFRMFKKNSL
jgi:Methylase of chemotaxis methyl-accepting proteins